MPTVIWEGMLTINNIQEVADRILEMLELKRYTFVAISDDDTLKPTVHTGQQLAPGGEPVRVRIDEQRRFANLFTGTWGLSTTLEEDTHDPEFNNPYLVFEQDSMHGDRVTITHRAGTSIKVCWVAAVEPD